LYSFFGVGRGDYKKGVASGNSLGGQMRPSCLMGIAGGGTVTRSGSFTKGSGIRRFCSKAGERARQTTKVEEMGGPIGGLGGPS